MQEDDKLRMMAEYVANSFFSHKQKQGIASHSLIKLYCN